MQRAGEVQDLLGEAPPPRVVAAVEVAALAEELAAYHAHFAPFFRRSEQRAWAGVYMRGLLTADVPRKNAEAMALRLLGAGDGAEARVRALQQFIGEGGWADDALLAEHRRLVDRTLGEGDGVLIVDESAIPKRGDHSAGVARQWCGALGKQENCQVGVFLGYASRKGYALLDRRLYLPKEWFGADHRERWAACRIPEETAFASKAELAGRVVATAMAGGLRARWLACDEWYGRDTGFLDAVAGHGLRYLAEVSKHTMVWPLGDPATGQASARPRTWIPPRGASGRGRVPVRQRVQPDSPPPLRVDAVAAPLAARRRRRAGGQILPVQRPGRRATSGARPGEWAALAHRVVLRGEQRGGRPRPVRAALLARVAPPHDHGDPRPSLPGPAPPAPGAERGGATSSRPQRNRQTRWPVWTSDRRPSCHRRSRPSPRASRRCPKCAACSAPPCRCPRWTRR